MRQQIDELDECLRVEEEGERSLDSAFTFEHVVVCSPQSKITFENLENCPLNDVRAGQQARTEYSSVAPGI